jgi:transketolase
MREAFVTTLLRKAKLDSRIVLLTGDLGFGVLDSFANELPNQYINCGINEQSMLGMAGGYASEGNTVFVYSIGNFPTLRALEQIRNDICAMNNMVTIVSVGAGYSYGPQGYTHHALEDIAVMRALPNLQVISPADPLETEKITEMLCHPLGPSYLRLGKSKETLIHEKTINVSPGKFLRILDGDQGTILFTGSIGIIAKQAANELRAMGLNIGLVSCPFISSLDVEELRKMAAAGPIVTVEEHSPRGGLASAVLETASFNEIVVNLKIIAAHQKHLSAIGTQQYLRELNGLSVTNIVHAFLG